MKPNKMTRKLTPKMWKREEIHTFLDEYKTTIEHSRDNPIEDEELVWYIVSEKLKEQGIDVSAAHCQSKWNFLFKTYVVNPDRDCAFNSQIKQILHLSQDIAAARESKDAIVKSEQDSRCQNVEVSEEVGANMSYDLEELDLHTESPDISKGRESKDGIEQIEQDTRGQNVDVSNEDGANMSYDLEELDVQTEETVSSPITLEIESIEAQPDDEVSIISLLQTLCNKIDTLTAIQTRQEAKLEQYYQLQKKNQESLLEIKKRLDIQ